jgi:hypothetical protein
MRKLFSLGVLALLLSVLSSPVVAAAEHCEILKEDGGSKGLYGMCIAYWNSVSNHDDGGLQSNRIEDSNRFLDRYNAIRDRVGGPEMPGLSSSPQLQCACWSYLTYDQALQGAFSADYGESGPPLNFETLEMKDVSGAKIRGFGAARFNFSCNHLNFIEGGWISIPVAGLLEKEFLQCQSELQIMNELGFE